MPLPGTWEPQHQGNDLFADGGTPAVAVRTGTVTPDEDPGSGGLVISLSVGGGRTLRSIRAPGAAAVGPYRTLSRAR